MLRADVLAHFVQDPIHCGYGVISGKVVAICKMIKQPEECAPTNQALAFAAVRKYFCVGWTREQTSQLQHAL
ncbi:MAG: hypothetical protein WBL50_10285 [Candidatus Acidiferrum sp.]